MLIAANQFLDLPQRLDRPGRLGASGAETVDLAQQVNTVLM